MSKKRLMFIYNPVSGKGKIQKKLASVIDTFIKAGYLVEVRPTQKAGDAKEIVTELSKDDFDFVACSGGDGTLDEIVSGMMTKEKEERLPIGYLPAGSTNDFANSLYIPSKTTYATINAIYGYPFKIDVGMLNNRNFVYVAAFGAFTAVSYETRQSLKNMLGHAAYILEGVKSLKDIRSYNMKIQADDTEIEGKFILGMITNTRSVGGFRGIINGERVVFDDGKFEVTLIRKPKTILGLNSIVAGLVGKTIRSEYVVSLSAKKIHIECDREVAWTVDGESGGNYKKVDIENLNREITIMVPSRKVLELSSHVRRKQK